MVIWVSFVAKLNRQVRLIGAVMLFMLAAFMMPSLAMADDLPASGSSSARQASAGLPTMPQSPANARGGPISVPMFVRLAPQPYGAPDYAQSASRSSAFSGLDGVDGSFIAGSRTRALDCLTMAIAYEAGHEPLAGQQAVAQVILNRTHQRRFPGSVCGVVFDGSQRMTGCQFTFTCDGSIRRQLRETTMESARTAAISVLSGKAPDWVNGATHYHANYVSPYWAATGKRVTQIGAHIFYRMPGDSGSSSASALSGNEPDIAALQDFDVPLRPRPQSRPRSSSPVAPKSLFAPWGVPMAAAGSTPGQVLGQN